MPSKHHLQVLPMTLCMLFCQHLQLGCVLIVEQCSSFPLLMSSWWRWDFAGATVPHRPSAGRCKGQGCGVAAPQQELLLAIQGPPRHTLAVGGS